MSSVIKKYGLIILGLFVLIFLIKIIVQEPTPQKKLDTALQNLFIDSPKMHNLYQDLMKKGGVTLVCNDLKNSEEGSTKVFEDGHVVVTIDIPQVTKSHDRLEPVIAHELFHVRDFQAMGYLDFVSIATEDKDLPWNQRRLEIRAFTEEDIIRKELLSTGHYGGMARTRGEVLSRNKN